MQVIKRDTPLNYEYAGNIKSTDEVKITSRVSGTIVEKYITGGEFVQAGQPLTKLTVVNMKVHCSQLKQH